MQLESPTLAPVASEIRLLGELLPLVQAQVLELGCGLAGKTREIMATYQPAEIIAAEVDKRALAHNLAQPQHPNIRFTADGAQAIQEADNSIDVVLMFKSLHHVPKAQLAVAMTEIQRVLKPGGLAYISEPVFDGELNEVIRLFHDEQQVRSDAFSAVKRAVATGLFELVEQRFFTAQVQLQSFQQFADGIIHATHSDHNLSPALYQAVERKFLSYGEQGKYSFATPNRIDLLRKPQT